MKRLVSLIFSFIMLSSSAYATHASSISPNSHGNKQIVHQAPVKGKGDHWKANVLSSGTVQVINTKTGTMRSYYSDGSRKFHH